MKNFKKVFNKENKKEVGAIVLLKIKEGKKNQVNDLVEKLVNNEKYASIYEFYINENSIHLHEKYTDSEAWIKHIDHFNENFGNEITNIFEVENVFSYGDISSKLKSTFESNTIHKEDIFVISFYAWLKNKAEDRKLYNTTLNLIHS